MLLTADATENLLNIKIINNKMKSESFSSLRYTHAYASTVLFATHSLLQNT